MPWPRMLSNWFKSRWYAAEFSLNWMMHFWDALTQMRYISHFYIISGIREAKEGSSIQHRCEHAIRARPRFIDPINISDQEGRILSCLHTDIRYTSKQCGNVEEKKEFAEKRSQYEEFTCRREKQFYMGRRNFTWLGPRAPPKTAKWTSLCLGLTSIYTDVFFFLWYLFFFTFLPSRIRWYTRANVIGYMNTPHRTRVICRSYPQEKENKERASLNLPLNPQRKPRCTRNIGEAVHIPLSITLMASGCTRKQGKHMRLDLS